MRSTSILLSATLLLSPVSAFAQTAPEPPLVQFPSPPPSPVPADPPSTTTQMSPSPGTQPPVEPPVRAGSWNDYPRGTAFEVNVLWPFFPGGIVDFRFQIPVLRVGRGHFRGELVLGLHSDFGWRFVRDANAGRVAFLGAKVGWRQFLVYGLHVEAVLHAGWRHEENNPWDGEPIDSFQGRLWLWAGYQHEFTPWVYANVRGGLGIHAFRTDRFADRERMFAPGGDLNLGFRFR